MKHCPKCGYELHDSVHFCPKCMYEYPRVDMKTTPSRRTRETKYMLILLLILSVAIIANRINSKKNDVNDEQENQVTMPELFMDEQTAPKNEDIAYDFRDDLTIYENVKERLSVSEIIEFNVDEYGNVESIYLNYENASEDNRKKYGIHGINGVSTKSDVITILGTPEQNYGETEYMYMFRGMIGMPSLVITFDDNGVVQDLMYYNH